MEKRILGRTGWAVSAIGFGAIKLPRVGVKECADLLSRALDHGINFIDTADCYGDSEEKIGQALTPRRQEFYLSTKVDERDGPGVRKKLERCLKRLRTEWIDLLLFHDVRGAEYEKIFSAGGLRELEKARQEGKISEIGISIHGSIPMMRQAVESGVFSVLMAAYSAMDEDRLTADLLPMAAAKGVGLIAMKPLAGGRLAQVPAKGWDSQLFQGESPAQIALRYVLSNPHIHCAIPGMMAVNELEENIVVGQKPRELSGEEIRKFMDLAGEAGKGFCRNCGYCLPCPNGVNIPYNFELYNQATVHKGNSMPLCRNLYLSLPEDQRAAACTDCGRCEDHCPQQIPIRESMKRVQEQFR